MLLTLLIIIVLDGSKFAQPFTANCSGLTEGSLNARHKPVKFDDFFQQLVPMRSYVYHSIVYNLSNRSHVRCSDVDDHYRIRFNWTSQVGAYQLYSKFVEMCSVYSLWKDAGGNLQARAGIRGRFMPHVFKIGYFDDRKPIRRVYFVTQNESRLMIEFWLTELTANSGTGSGTGQDCNVSVLDLSLLEEMMSEFLSSRKKKEWISLSGLLAIFGVAASWMMIRCYQRIYNSQSDDSVMYRNAD